MSKHAVSLLFFKHLDLGPENAEILLVCEGISSKFDAKDTWIWQLPGGKCCDKKWINVNCCTESPEETARREFSEETGLVAESLKLFLEFEGLNPESREKFRKFIFLIEKGSGSLLENKTPSGNFSPKWFRLKEFPRNSFPSHQKLILNFFTKKPLRK